LSELFFIVRVDKKGLEGNFLTRQEFLGSELEGNLLTLSVIILRKPPSSFYQHGQAWSSHACSRVVLLEMLSGWLEINVLSPDFTFSHHKISTKVIFCIYLLLSTKHQQSFVSIFFSLLSINSLTITYNG
jgi:hypothetical protein